MKKFRFRQFKELSGKFPLEEKFSLTNQLWKALDSIILNIAEGADRGTDKDFAHFLNNAHTSLNEVVACIDLALDDLSLAGAAWFWPRLCAAELGAD